MKSVLDKTTILAHGTLSASLDAKRWDVRHHITAADGARVRVRVLHLVTTSHPTALPYT